VPNEHRLDEQNSNSQRRENLMTKGSGTRIAVLFLLLMAHLLRGVTAQADDSSDFRLIIMDQSGNARVVTNNVGNVLTGDGNNASDTIDFTNHFDGTSYSIQINATSDINPDGTGALTLSGQVGCNVTGGCANITIMLEDDTYSTALLAPNAAFVSGLEGYNAVNNTIVPQGTLANGASLSVQSWIGTANVEPNFGTTNGSITLNPAGITNAETITSGDVAESPLGSPVVPTFSGPSYSEILRADLSFSQNGVSNFTLTAAEAPPASVPEPTSLLLLGSTLLGLGIFRKKRM
jgi:hypothetical protein